MKREEKNSWYGMITCMLNFLKIKLQKKEKDDIQKVAEKQLKKNMTTIESLRDYDAGKKDISIRTAEKRLPHIRIFA